MKGLAFSRSFLLQRDQAVFDKIKNVSIVYLTDSSNKKIKNIYKVMHQFYQKNEIIQIDDLDGIIRRCRLLRNIERNEAEKLVSSVYLAFLSMVEWDQLDFVYSQAVDNYILEILYKLAIEKNIPFIGISESYFENYTYITSGTKPGLKRKDVSLEEVEKVKKKILVKNYRRDYAQINSYGILKHIKLHLRYQIKRLYFYWKKQFNYKNLNYHYNVLPYIAERSRLLNYPAKGLFCDFSLELMDNSRPIIYIPLSFTPEMSTDYWIEDDSFIDYETKMILIFKELSKKFNVLIKDHFHILGIRKNSFYHQLNSIEFVYNINPAKNSNELVELSDMILLGAGSAGLESICRNQKVATYANDIYWISKENTLDLSKSSLETWNKKIVNYLNTEHEAIDIDQYLKNALSYHFNHSLTKKIEKSFDFKELQQDLILLEEQHI